MESARPSDRIKETLVEHMLSSGARWHMDSVRQQAQNAGISDDELALAIPGGVADLIVYLSSRADRDAHTIITASDMRTLGVRERIRRAVQTRLNVHADSRDAMRAIALGAAAPWRLQTAPRTLWATSDMIWHAIGDRSTDGNWYSKRVILSGVLAATILPWLEGDDEAAWSRLDRALDQVMVIEKCKQRVQEPFAALADSLFGGRTARKDSHR